MDMQPESTNLSTRPAKQSNTSSVQVSMLLHVDSWIFFKDNVNEWVTFACDGTGPADESKTTKRVQGWFRLNWLGGILIIVSWHIHFNKLLMPLTPVCCFANYVQRLQYGLQTLTSPQNFLEIWNWSACTKSCRPLF